MGYYPAAYVTDGGFDYAVTVLPCVQNPDRWSFVISTNDFLSAGMWLFEAEGCFASDVEALTAGRAWFDDPRDFPRIEGSIMEPNAARAVATMKRLADDKRAQNARRNER